MYLTIWQFFLTGGVFMWPILFCSVLSFAIAIWQGKASLDFKRSTGAFFLFLRSRGASGSGVLGGMTKDSFESNPVKALKLAGEKVQMEFDRMGKPIELIAALGGIAPLLGFLGTVSGMIAAFQAIALADKISIKLVAGGIAEAMITTGFGLIVAIPCMFMESFFRYYLTSRAHKASEELSEVENSLESAP